MFFLQHLLALMITGCLAVSCQGTKQLKIQGLLRLTAYGAPFWFDDGVWTSSEEIEQKQDATFHLEMEIVLDKNFIKQIRELLPMKKIYTPSSGSEGQATFLYRDSNACYLHTWVQCTGAEIKKIERKINQRVGAEATMRQFILQQPTKPHGRDTISLDYKEREIHFERRGYYSGQIVPWYTIGSIENPPLSVYLATMPKLDLRAKSTYHN